MSDATIKDSGCGLLQIMRSLDTKSHKSEIDLLFKKKQAIETRMRNYFKQTFESQNFLKFFRYRNNKPFLLSVTLCIKSNEYFSNINDSTIVQVISFSIYLKILKPSCIYYSKKFKTCCSIVLLSKPFIEVKMSPSVTHVTKLLRLKYFTFSCIIRELFGLVRQNKSTYSLNYCFKNNLK